MTPQEHIEWLQDNVSWYEGLAIDHLAIPVPHCPGWEIADLLNHLTLCNDRTGHR